VKRDHSKQGKARGSTSLSGQKPRLLTMALLFAVLAGAGLAFGEETDETGQTNNQDADPKVIQLDGPIRPSAIITKDGVVIPEYPESQTKKPYKEQNRVQTEPGGGSIIPPVQFEVKSETKAKPSSPKSYPRNAYTSGDPVYDDNFYSEFQMEDAQKLERKYTVVLPEYKIDYERIKREDKEKYRYTSEVGELYPNIHLRWKNLGLKTIRDKKYYVWQSAIKATNSIGTGALVRTNNIPPYSYIKAYGLNSRPQVNNWRKYIISDSDTQKGPYPGDTMIFELTTPDPSIDPNKVEYLIIKGIMYDLYKVGLFTDIITQTSSTLSININTIISSYDKMPKDDDLINHNSIFMNVSNKSTFLPGQQEKVNEMADHMRRQHKWPKYLSREEALSLPKEYIIDLKDIANDVSLISRDQAYGILSVKPQIRQLPWKYLGNKNVGDYKKHVWIFAMQYDGAKDIGITLTNVISVGDGEYHFYGSAGDPSSHKAVYQPYDNRISGVRVGNVIYIEYADSDIRNSPIGKNQFEIESIRIYLSRD